MPRKRKQLDEELHEKIKRGLVGFMRLQPGRKVYCGNLRDGAHSLLKNLDCRRSLGVNAIDHVLDVVKTNDMFEITEDGVIITIGLKHRRSTPSKKPKSTKKPRTRIDSRHKRARRPRVAART